MRTGFVVIAMCLLALPGAGAEEADPDEVRAARKAVTESREALISRLRLTARVAEAAGHTDRAIAAWRRLIRLDPEKADNHFELLNLLIRTKDAAGAVPVVEQLEKLLPNDPRPLYCRALVHRAAGDAGAFDAACKKAMALSARSSARLRIADFFDRLGYPEIAELELETLAKGRGRGAARAVATLGERAWMLEDYAKALPYYERAEALLRRSGVEMRGGRRGPTDYRLMLCRAAVALADGDDSTALATLRTLHETHPDRIEAAVLLVREFRARGEAGLAEATRAKTAAIFRNMIERNPQSSVGYNGLAWFLALVGDDLEEAKALSRKSLAIDPGTPAYLDTLAEILHRDGNHTEALELIDYALAQRPAGRQYYERQRRKFQESLNEAKTNE